MNAVVSLCHFCEVHGPSVLLLTQPFHESNVRPEPLTRDVTCDACQACQEGFVCNDLENKITYLSIQQAPSNVAHLVQQACIRSLSCEVSSGGQALFYGDDIRGHVLSRTFTLQDAQARGFHRYFSICVVMKDKLYLLNSWPFLTKHIGTLIDELQAKAAMVYQHEQTECPQRKLRLQAAAANEKTCNKSSRSLMELAGDNLIFSHIHLTFTFLLKGGGERLIERIPQVAGPERERSATSLRQLLRLLGNTTFFSLVYGILIGKQIVVRGQPESLIRSILTCLEQLLPCGVGNTVYNAAEYLDIACCNLLGVETRVAVPRLSHDILRLDVLDTQYTSKLTWSEQLPDKWPTLLYKMEKALVNPNLSDSVLDYHLNALKIEWSNTAKLLGSLQQPPDVGLMQALGIQDQDKQLIDFWMNPVDNRV